MSWTIVMSRLGHSYKTSVHRWVLDKNFFLCLKRGKGYHLFFSKQHAKRHAKVPKKIHLTYSATVQRLDKRFFFILQSRILVTPHMKKYKKVFLRNNVALQTIWSCESFPIENNWTSIDLWVLYSSTGTNTQDRIRLFSTVLEWYSFFYYTDCQFHINDCYATASSRTSTFV